MTGRLVSLVLTACLIGAGCSISAHSSATPVDDAPDDLLNPITTAPPQPDEDDTYQLVLMFVNSSGRRVRVVRTQESEPTVQNVLDGLANQPTESERAEHTDNPITSPLLPSMIPTDTGTESGVLRVGVEGPELREIATETPDALTLIYGQIVCSVVELEESGIDFVEVFDAEGRIDALPDGGPVTPIDRPVGPEQYNNCATASEIALAEAEESTTESTDG
jgi:hypothetical protein